MQVLEDRQEWLLLALAQAYPLEGVERALAALGWIELPKRAVFRQGVQERQQRRDGVLQCRIERQHLPGHLGADGARVIALLHVTVALEHIDDREVRGRLAIRHRGAFEDQPPWRVVRVDELIDQPRLPDAGLPDHGCYL